MRSYQWEPETNQCWVNVSGHRRRLKQIPTHSGDGFTSGHAAGGGLDLALAILLDAIPRPRRNREAPRRYKAFARQIIKELPASRHWTLSQTQIEAWLSVQRQADQTS